jgi:3-ketosteroid 9alpha-monooxygenase subunit A
MATTAEYGLGEFTFPRGWFVVAEADELDNGPIGVRFFAKDFVIYRGESGKVVMLDAYCPHMGTHLCKNTTSYIVRDGTQVQGDSIRCPYHAWRFGADGVCDDIPYAKKIPAAAKVNSYTVVEQAGVIFMWHDEEGLEPEFKLPAMPEWDIPGYVRWKLDHLGTLPIHGQEVLDNMTDYAHFVPVHGSTQAAYFENEFRGPISVQRFGAGHRTLVTDGNILETDTWYTGPGILMSRMKGNHPSLMIIANTPVEDGVTRVWHALMVHSGKDVATEEDVPMGRAYQEASRQAFAQDFEIWTHKKPALQILQIPEDGPYNKGRIWYSQFFNARVKAPLIQARVNGIALTKNQGESPDKEQRPFDTIAA